MSDTIPPNATFEDLQKSGWYKRAKAIPPKSRKGAWSAIMLTAVLQEVWERMYIGDERLNSNELKQITDKHHTCTLAWNSVKYFGLTTKPPTIQDAYNILKNRAAKCLANRKSQTIPEVEFEAVVKCNEDEMMINYLTNARDWLNEHGYECEVKLIKRLI